MTRAPSTPPPRAKDDGAVRQSEQNNGFEDALGRADTSTSEAGRSDQTAVEGDQPRDTGRQTLSGRGRAGTEEAPFMRKSILAGLLCAAGLVITGGRRGRKHGACANPGPRPVPGSASSIQRRIARRRRLSAPSAAPASARRWGRVRRPTSAGPMGNRRAKRRNKTGGSGRGAARFGNCEQTRCGDMLTAKPRRQAAALLA